MSRLTGDVRDVSSEPSLGRREEQQRVDVMMIRNWQLEVAERERERESLERETIDSGKPNYAHTPTPS